MHENSSGRRLVTAGAGTIALSLSLFAGQLVATSGAAASTSIPAASVAAAAKKQVSIRTTYTPRTLKIGGSVKITVTYRNPANGAAVTSGTVRLQALRNGKWSTWAARNLNKKGTATFTAKPRVTGYFRTVYTGNAVFAGRVGGATRITVVAPSSSRAAKVLAEARKHVGKLYLYGAAGPNRFDCSGYTMYVYRKSIGVKLPHKADSQQRYGRAVSKGAKKPGDLLITRSGGYGYHAAIYAGNGYMYDSPHSGARISKRKIFSQNYVVRRLA
ncbi:C40 family peptidase [Paractinoplanes atraurantiacus]|uniref:Cell wall-associated hydrolase, NlpC family n=1 Tax=Paractinoplanes atraurantiacus TaxID=1036182 RepID=A0A285JZ26_9ACTN|nr:NlpC/P60 family protein [Actinoplanes atraurantiacus]SNY64331.1 Cell wall-associated hydrolase, NlpC family [Actinoplanes atraurantiacus]